MCKALQQLAREVKEKLPLSAIPACPIENQLALKPGLQNTGCSNLGNRNGEELTVQDDQIGVLTHLNRTGDILLIQRKSAAQGKNLGTIYLTQLPKTTPRPPKSP